MAAIVSGGSNSDKEDATNVTGDFEKQKVKSLSGIDNSKKGSVDSRIIDLVNFINRSNDFFTTSSCSGRLAVISEGCMKKKGCNWLFMSHEEAQPADVLKVLKETFTGASAVLKYEPFVLHMQCRDLEKAISMLQVALQSGFRNSGLVIGRKKRIMLAVRSTHAMEVPLILSSKLMVSEEYIMEVVQICNQKLEENFQRINRFFDGMKAKFTST